MKPRCAGFLLVMTTACAAAPERGDRTVAAADGAQIVYDVRGEGETAIVFVHCWGCNREFWRGQLDEFARDHLVVAIDLPGHGAAGRDRTDWTLAAYADDVVRVVDALDLENVVLVGHSMGGPVSLLAAGKLGDRVAGLVCVDEFHDATYTWPEAVAQHWVTSMKQDYEGTMRNGVVMMAGADSGLAAWIGDQALLASREALIGLVPEFSRFSLSEALSAVKAPIRCVNAAPYNEFALATAIETNRRYADYDAVVWEGVGHFLHLERPAEFNQALRGFIAGF